MCLDDVVLLLEFTSERTYLSPFTKDIRGVDYTK